MNIVLENTDLQHSHLNPSFFLNMVIKFPSGWKWKWNTFTKISSRNPYPPGKKISPYMINLWGSRMKSNVYRAHPNSPTLSWVVSCMLFVSFAPLNTNNMGRRQVTCQGPIDSKSWSPGSRPSSSDPKALAFSIVRSPSSIHLTLKCSTFKTVLQKFFKCSIKAHSWFCAD